MKKTLLALATTSSLIVSGSALAAFVDAPKGEGSAADPQIEITGTLTNNNPNWMWQIPAVSQSVVTDVVIQKITGVVSGSNTEFSVTKKALSILEGYTKRLIPNGGAGLTPVVKVGGVDMRGCSGPNGICTIIIDAANAGAKVGEISMRIMMTGGGYSTNELNIKYSTLPSAQGISQEALDLAWKTVGVEAAYQGSITRNKDYSIDTVDNWLKSPTLYKSAQGRVVTLASSKLVVPTTAIPATWAASLPITISVK
jgi:hypothetical protein